MRDLDKPGGGSVKPKHETVWLVLVGVISVIIILELSTV